MPSVTMTVNGQQVTRDVEGRTLLTDFLRQDLALTGTHVGCDTSQCGACVVHVDGKSVKACTLLAVQADGADASMSTWTRPFFAPVVGSVSLLPVSTTALWR